MPKRKQIQSGFTTVELVVVIVVFALLLPAIAGMISSIGVINTRARNAIAINSLAENKIESFRNIGFDNLTVENDPDCFAGELPDYITPADPTGCEVSLVAGSDALKQVDIEISYKDFSQTRMLTYRTYVGENGIGR